jgi:hypothetical protein
MKTTRLTGVQGMWYVNSPELGPMPTLSMTSIVTSKGFGRETKLAFGPPSDSSLRRATALGRKNYWDSMGVTPYIALTLNRDDAGDPRSYLGVFRVTDFKMDSGVAADRPMTASIIIHELFAVHDKDAPIAA